MRQGLFAMEMAKLVGESEAIRQKERRTDRRHRLFGRVRGVFIFLLGSTLFVYAFCNEKGLQNFIFARLDELSQAVNKSDSLRQNAINREKEVDEVTK